MGGGGQSPAAHVPQAAHSRSSRSRRPYATGGGKCAWVPRRGPGGEAGMRSCLFLPPTVVCRSLAVAPLEPAVVLVAVVKAVTEKAFFPLAPLAYLALSTILAQTVDTDHHKTKRRAGAPSQQTASRRTAGIACDFPDRAQPLPFLPSSHVDRRCEGRWRPPLPVAADTATSSGGARVGCALRHCCWTVEKGCLAMRRGGADGWAASSRQHVASLSGVSGTAPHCRRETG